MKKLIIFALAILALLFGNAGANSKTDLEGDLIAAQLYCFSLEDLLFEFKENYQSKDDVCKFFRQGFGHSLSEKLANNVWTDSQVKLKHNDKIMEPPKGVKFESVTKKSAVISFQTPAHRKHIWGNSEITELTFKREDGRWKLFQKE